MNFKYFINIWWQNILKGLMRSQNSKRSACILKLDIVGRCLYIFEHLNSTKATKISLVYKDFKVIGQVLANHSFKMYILKWLMILNAKNNILSEKINLIKNLQIQPNLEKQITHSQFMEDIFNNQGPTIIYRSLQGLNQLELRKLIIVLANQNIGYIVVGIEGQTKQTMKGMLFMKRQDAEGLRKLIYNAYSRIWNSKYINIDVCSIPSPNQHKDYRLIQIKIESIREKICFHIRNKNLNNTNWDLIFYDKQKQNQQEKYIINSIEGQEIYKIIHKSYIRDRPNRNILETKQGINFKFHEGFIVQDSNKLTLFANPQNYQNLLIQYISLLSSSRVEAQFPYVNSKFETVKIILFNFIAQDTPDSISKRLNESLNPNNQIRLIFPFLNVQFDIIQSKHEAFSYHCQYYFGFAIDKSKKRIQGFQSIKVFRLKYLFEIPQINKTLWIQVYQEIKKKFNFQMKSSEQTIKYDQSTSQITSKITIYFSKGEGEEKIMLYLYYILHILQVRVSLRKI